MLGPISGTIHNLWFYLDLVARLRQAIVDGRFESLRVELLEQFGASPA